MAAAVRSGEFKSGRQHFDACGRKERREIRIANAIADTQRHKIGRLEPLLKLDMPHLRRGLKYDFLSDQLREAAAIVDTPAVASSDYDPFAHSLIGKFKDGLLLDCGSGRRHVYYHNVVNFDVVDYDSTDIIGVGEALPFQDNSFDGVLSLSVLEHVRDPFTCAGEIVRVLKPGGHLICSAPFLAPLHGYRTTTTT